MNIWKLVAGVVLVLVVGILIGSIGTWLLLKPPHPPWPRDPKARAAEALERLSKDLDLTHDQKVVVKKILERMSERLREHFVRQRPQMEKIVDESFSEIKKELTEDQKKKLDEVRERFRRHGGPPPPHGGPPPPPPPGEPPPPPPPPGEPPPPPPKDEPR
jgi:hypothetical protein